VALESGFRPAVPLSCCALGDRFSPARWQILVRSQIFSCWLSVSEPRPVQILTPPLISSSYCLGFLCWHSGSPLDLLERSGKASLSPVRVAARVNSVLATRLLDLSPACPSSTPALLFLLGRSSAVSCHADSVVFSTGVSIQARILVRRCHVSLADC
jgi:hypothetical protein